MRWMLVLGLSLTGCYHEHYYAPPPDVREPGPPPSFAAQPINIGQGVKGSDGSFGWRSRAANVDEAYGHAVALAEMHGCAMLSRDGEANADCGGVRIVVRRDQEHLYRLCAAGTDRSQCAATWAMISR